MKQRLTYLLRNPSEFSPSQIQVRDDAVSVRGLNAAQEQHLTLGLNELPQEIKRVLQQCHELHLRWASPSAYQGVAPYVSRVSPGLHAFFTPRRGQSADLLCPLLKRLFGESLKCESPDSTFVAQPVLSERFSTSASFSYFHHLSQEQWHYFVRYLHTKSCAANDFCAHSLGDVLSAKYADFDYDAISHAVVLKAYWDEYPIQDEGWSETMTLQPKVGSIEVGVLNTEIPDEPEELKLGGFLTVVGQDTEPKATLFSFPARHHALPSSSNGLFYSVSFKYPTGLHPILEISFPPDLLVPPAESCALHTYLTLPSYLFIDKYQFDDPLFLASQFLRRMRSISGETDLEAPDYVIKKWGSAALFELAHPAASQRTRHEWKATIPLHLRYLQPTNGTGGLTGVEVPWPVVFWACDAEEGLKMASSPFDRVNLGYDGLFGPRTMFYHVPPAPGARLLATLMVPVLDLAQADFINFGTIAAIIAGALWVSWMLFRVSAKRQRKATRETKDKKRQ